MMHSLIWVYVLCYAFVDSRARICGVLCYALICSKTMPNMEFVEYNHTQLSVGTHEGCVIARQLSNIFED